MSLFLLTFTLVTPVRARDLNDIFEKLQFGLEEAICKAENAVVGDDDDFLEKEDETIYSTEDWRVDDETIASTGAIEKRLDTIFEGDKVITGVDQDNQRWVSLTN